MFGVRLSTTALVEYLLLPVSATETSALLLRYRFLFLGLNMERFDRRARSAFDRKRCLLTQQRSATGT